MTHFDHLMQAADLLEAMAGSIPNHPLLEISAKAMADRAAKSALSDKAHELRLKAAEAVGLPEDDSV